MFKLRILVNVQRDTFTNTTDGCVDFTINDVFSQSYSSINFTTNCDLIDMENIFSIQRHHNNSSEIKKLFVLTTIQRFSEI